MICVTIVTIGEITALTRNGLHNKVYKCGIF